MEAVITALTTALTPAALWGAVAEVVPVTVVLILFSLGLTFARRAVKGAGKGKAKL